MFILIPLCLWIIYLTYSLFRRRFEYEKIKSVFKNVTFGSEGLMVSTTGIMGKPWISGYAHGNSVLIELLPGLVRSIDIRIVKPDDFPYHLRISDMFLLDDTKPSLILTSNDDFNSKIFISSLYTTGATALMDKATRNLLHTIFSVSSLFSLEGNRISLRFSYSLKDITSIESTTKKMLRCTLDLVKRLTPPKNIKDALSKNVLTDTDKFIRRRNLELLRTHFNFEDLKDILKKALLDSDREIKFMAADHLGKEGLMHLYTLFHEVPVMDMDFRLKVAASIARIHGPESMNFLMKLYKRLDLMEHRLKMIRLFDKYGDRQVSNLLIKELKEDLEYDLKLAVIIALGNCGTLDAVEPLYQISKQLIILPSLKIAAKRSISRIQSCFGSGDKGWLSISDEDQSEGSLSLVDRDEDGE